MFRRGCAISIRSLLDKSADVSFFEQPKSTAGVVPRRYTTRKGGFYFRRGNARLRQSPEFNFRAKVNRPHFSPDSLRSENDEHGGGKVLTKNGPGRN